MLLPKVLLRPTPHPSSGCRDAPWGWGPRHIKAPPAPGPTVGHPPGTYSAKVRGVRAGGAHGHRVAGGGGHVEDGAGLGGAGHGRGRRQLIAEGGLCGGRYGVSTVARPRTSWAMLAARAVCPVLLSVKSKGAMATPHPGLEGELQSLEIQALGCFPA